MTARMAPYDCQGSGHLLVTSPRSQASQTFVNHCKPLSPFTSSLGVVLFAETQESKIPSQAAQFLPIGQSRLRMLGIQSTADPRRTSHTHVIPAPARDSEWHAPRTVHRVLESVTEAWVLHRQTQQPHLTCIFPHPRPRTPAEHQQRSYASFFSHAHQQSPSTAVYSGRAGRMPSSLSRIMDGARRHFGDSLSPDDAYLSCECCLGLGGSIMLMNGRP